MKKVLLALSLCASTALLAHDANYEWEFTPTIGGTLHEGNMDLDDSFTFGLRVAKNLSEDWWLDQIELGYDYQDSVGLHGLSDKPGAEKPDVHSYFVNVVKDLYHFNDDFKLYGLAGLGYMDYSSKVGGEDYDDGFGQYGLGLKYYYTDNFATKLEVRDAISFHEADHTMFYTLGFAADIGKRFADPEPVAQVGDEDGDGVLDDVDRCPGTPAGVVVDEFGCEKIIRLDLGVNFAFDSAKIKPEAMGEIRKVSDFLNEHPDYSVVLEGHTDSKGSEAYNQKLSEKRAAAVADALVSLGVSSDRISSVGFGESQPIADNSTAAGRAKNRRVDAKFRK